MRLVPGLLACAVLSVASFAQQRADLHFADAAAMLYQRSAFAHGYIHGYEEGFHLADVDIQMGHLLPGVRARRDPRDLNSGYRPNFGDKGLFNDGFRLGLHAGYLDSLTGREFRAVDALRTAAFGLTASQPSSHFDRAFADGYSAGEKFGASDPGLLNDFGHVGAYCRTQIKRDDASRPNYCDAYARGYQLGYQDGHAEFQNGAAVQTALNHK